MNDSEDFKPAPTPVPRPRRMGLMATMLAAVCAPFGFFGGTSSGAVLPLIPVRKREDEEKLAADLAASLIGDHGRSTVWGRTAKKVRSLKGWRNPFKGIAVHATGVAPVSGRALLTTDDADERGCRRRGGVCEVGQI